MAAPLARGWSFMSDNNLDVALSVTDEQGKPIPYVTVWGYLLPSASAQGVPGEPIDGEDLWRVTTRYQSSFEFALPVVGNRPVSYLEVFPMGDAGGRIKQVIDYARFEGYGKRRPAAMQVGFTVMKHGYLPARIDFPMQDESHVTGKIALKRDPHQAVETQPYMQEFERIRYELSDTSRNENMSGGTYERDEALRKGLEAAAGQAIEAGNKAAAARIYARMQYLPTIQMFQGKAIGFTQAEPYSEQSWAYLVKAYQLDPSHPYIAAEYLFKRGSDEFRRYSPDKASDEQKQAFEAFLAKLDALMQASGPQIWPTYHELYARWHQESSDPKERAKMIPLLEALYQFEPKFKTKDNLLHPPFL